ncbi:MAG: alginate export family protein [Bacteroidota bacterium]
MKKTVLICFTYILSLLPVLAQSQYDFSLLRQDDKIEIDSTDDKSFYSSIKQIPLSNPGSYLSFGGSYRGQYERFRNENFSDEDDPDNGWYLQRFLLHAHAQLGNNFSIFGEVGSSTISGKENLAPVDKDELYVNQLFVQFTKDNVTFKVGRENLKIGSRRLVDPREGPNVRRSFDHASLFIALGESRFRAFAGKPMQPQFGIFDNDFLTDDESIWGLYGERLFNISDFHLDAYYIGNFQEQAEYELGIEDETRHSLGARIWGTNGKWGFDNEAIIQFGTFGDTNILAWTASVNTWLDVTEKHRLGIKSELISGDREGGALNTFNPLYPRGAYFGRVARFGPANLIDIHPYWNFTKGKLFIEIDYDVFWRFTTDDAVYDPALNLVLGANANGGLIAHQIGTLFSYEFSPFAAIELETNYILTADFIDNSVQNGANLVHMVFTTQLRF